MGRMQKNMVDVYIKSVCAFKAVKAEVTAFVKHCMVTFESAIAISFFKVATSLGLRLFIDLWKQVHYSIG